MALVLTALCVGGFGHGELLILFGLFVALAGAESFELVGLKPDLGALVLGMLLAPHAKAEELSRSLMGFKNLFLVGFFLDVGLRGSPSFAALGIALLLAMLVPFKVALFFILLTRFRLRARTGLLASRILLLGNVTNGRDYKPPFVGIDGIQADLGREFMPTLVQAAQLQIVAHLAAGRTLDERIALFSMGTPKLVGDQMLDWLAIKFAGSVPKYGLNLGVCVGDSPVRGDENHGIRRRFDDLAEVVRGKAI